MFKKLVILTAIVYGMFYQHTFYAADHSLEKFDRCVRSSDQGWVYPKLNLFTMKRIAANLNTTKTNQSLDNKQLPKITTIGSLQLSGKKSFELDHNTQVAGQTCLSGKAIMHAKDNTTFNTAVLSGKSQLIAGNNAIFNGDVSLSSKSILEVGQNAQFNKTIHLGYRSSLSSGPGAIFNNIIISNTGTFNPVFPYTIRGTIITANDRHEQKPQPAVTSIKTRFCSPSVIINCDSGSTLTIGQDSKEQSSKLYVGLAGIFAWGALFASKR